MLVRGDPIKIMAASFKIFTGILIRPVAFTGFKSLIILLICSALAAFFFF